jgi:hypothetical protein
MIISEAKQFDLLARENVMSRLILICSMLLMNSVWADELPPIGYVKNITGEATVTTSGDIIRAKVGTPIYQSSVLNTRTQSSMGITLKDATVISLGPETEFAIDEYAYAPAKNKLKLGSRITKGSLNYVSGVIAKLQPEAVKIKTPAGTIGVRGTRFVVKVE